MPTQNDYELLIDTLVEREDTFSHSGEFTDSSMQEAKRDLDLLQARLRLPAPEDEFEAESACKQALELVEAIGRDPSFSTRQLAATRAHTSDADEPLPGGGLVGQYQLLMKLGQGGFGAVYKALHSRLDKVVALKVLTPSRLQNPQAVSRFNREMRAVGKLHHANIVAAHDAGESDGMHYLVMELVDGIDLRELVKQRGRLPIGAACELIRQAALGLQHAHENGLVHRDIKPSNLMLTLPQSHEEVPSVKVLDLGLALLEEDHLENFGELTATGQVMGTLEYMAPEQGSDTHDVDIRADVYSLGASLYKLLTGKAPFSADQYRSPVKLLMAVATQDPPPLVERCPEITPDLEAIIQRMLSKQPTDRFATPRDVANALAPYSQPADLRTLVDFLATAPAQEPVDVNAPAFVGTQATKLPSHTSPQRTAPETTTYIGARPFVQRDGSNWASSIALAFGACAVLIAAALYLIEVRTPRGTLVIHSDFPDIKVKIHRDGKEIVSGWSLQKGQDNKQLISTGEIEIELPAELSGEYSVTPARVTLTKDKREIVKIERKATSRTEDDDAHDHAHGDGNIVQSKPVGLPPTANTVDRDRIAADRERAAAKLWQQRNGEGALRMIASGNWIALAPSSKLPDQPFHIKALYGSKFEGLTNEDLEAFTNLAALSSFHLTGADIDEGAIQYLKQMPSLVDLDLSGTLIRTSALAQLRDLPHLQLLGVSGPMIDDNLRFLGQLKETYRFGTSDFQPTAADWQQLRRIPHLRNIAFTEEKLDLEEVAEFQKTNPACQVMVGTPPRTIGVDPMREAVRQLAQQNIGFNIQVSQRVSRGGTVQEVLDNPARFYVDTLEFRIPDEHIAINREVLSPVRAIWSDNLIIRSEGISVDDFIAALPDDIRGQHINLADTNLSDSGLQRLSHIARPISLNVSRTQVTENGIKRFLQIRPACTIQSDHGTLGGSRLADQPTAQNTPAQPANDPDRIAASNSIASGGNATIVLKNNGKQLRLSENDKLPSSPFETRAVEVSGNALNLSSLAGLRNLQSVEIRGDKIDLQAIRFLSQIPNLRQIRFATTHIWTSEFAQLNKLPFLHQIELSANQVDDDWKFLGNLPHLRTLILNDYRQASAPDFQKWSEFPQLRTIQIEAQVNDEIIVKLQQKNPLCRVIALSNDPPKTWKLEVKGVDPVRAGARSLMSQGFRLSSDDRWEAGQELKAAIVRDQRLKSPFSVRRVWVPPRATFTWDSLSGFDKFDFHALDAAGLVQADTFVSSLPGRFAADEINLSKSDLTDKGLLFMFRLKDFPVLKVVGTKVTQAGIEQFKKARPSCRVISDFDLSAEMMFPDQAPLATVQLAAPADPERAAVELWQQRLGSGHVFTEGPPGTANFDPFRDVQPGRVQFVLAQGAGLQGLTNDDLKVFANLGGLKYLEPRGPEIDIGAISYIKQIPTLIDLEVGGSRIPTSAIAELGSHIHLINLGVTGKMVDDQWKFLDFLPTLRCLRIHDLKPTAEDWQHLQVGRKLRQLHFFSDVELAPDDVTLFQQNNPLCRVMVGYPKKRSIGNDPQREAVRQLISKDMGMNIGIGDPLHAPVGQVLADPYPFYVDFIHIKLPKEAPIDAENLKPLQAILFNEFRVLWEGGNTDEFVANMPSELAAQRVNLTGCDLTDKGLLRMHLMSPPSILDIRSTKVTREGVMAYQKKFPTCKVLSDP